MAGWPEIGGTRWSDAAGLRRVEGRPAEGRLSAKRPAEGRRSAAPSLLSPQVAYFIWKVVLSNLSRTKKYGVPDYRAER